MHFPLSGHAQDFHLLEFAHAGQTKVEATIKGGLTLQVNDILNPSPVILGDQTYT